MFFLIWRKMYNFFFSTTKIYPTGGPLMAGSFFIFRLSFKVFSHVARVLLVFIRMSPPSSREKPLYKRTQSKYKWTMRSSVCSHAESPALHSSVCVFFSFSPKINPFFFITSIHCTVCARSECWVSNRSSYIRLLTWSKLKKNEPYVLVNDR